MILYFACSDLFSFEMFVMFVIYSPANGWASPAQSLRGNSHYDSENCNTEPDKSGNANALCVGVQALVRPRPRYVIAMNHAMVTGLLPYSLVQA